MIIHSALKGKDDASKFPERLLDADLGRRRESQWVRTPKKSEREVIES